MILERSKAGYKVPGRTPLKDHPVLVMGVASDILFPAWQQREIAETLRAGGKRTHPTGLH
jgi:homoserine acetyltransferase